MYLVYRIWQIPLVEKFLEEHDLALGKDKKAILLEDDWKNKYSHWTRWDGKREELGSLALLHLNSIIQGKSAPENNLVHLNLICSDSFK